MIRPIKRHQNASLEHSSRQADSKSLSAHQQQLDRYHMQNCLDLIKDDYDQTVDVPVAATIINEAQEVIGESINQSITNNDPTAHAEIAVIRQACLRQGNYRLSKCTLYVTLEPCLMCFSACMHARVDRIVFAASDYKVGILSQAVYQEIHAAGNHHFCWTGGVLADTASQRIQDFFRLNCRQ